MILTIDIGNTNQKYALFKNNKLILNKNFKDLGDVINLSAKVKIISSVKKNIALNDCISINSLRINNKLLDMPIHYEHTLGEDRIAASYYAYKSKYERSIVIDTGSFTTVDFIDHKKGFLGGHILPGLKLLQQTYSHGDLLCEYDLTLPKGELPNSTEKAISDGLYYSFVSPIKSIIKSFDSDQIFITGGNANKLQTYLNLDKTQVYKNLTHKGMHLMAKEISK